MKKLAMVLAAFASAGVAAIACHSNPSVDSNAVPTVGSLTDPPTCAQVCNRLSALCGYAPVDCTTPDAGGYCDVNLTDDAERICVGYGTQDDAGVITLTKSCQAAWSCIDDEPPPEEPTGDAATDDAATDDDAGTSDDAATGDAASGDSGADAG